jgi:hypothetical protein
MSQKVVETVSMWLMIAGIVFLCQPWVPLLHAWSVTIMLVGLVGFNIAAHMPADRRIDEDDTGPVSVSEAMKSGGGHG